jgi:uncharacterized protein involved in outer membrane biogenesis
MTPHSTSSRPTPARAARAPAPRRHQILKGLLAFVLLLIAFLMWFQWDWLRVPVQNYISEKTQREFRMSHLDVKLGRYPKVILDNVYFQNADWSKNGPMAQIGKLEFTVSPRDLLERKVIVPRLALSNADVVMEELKDGRRNWIFSDPNDKSETVFRISTLSVNHGKLRYINHGQQFDLNIEANTFDPDAPDVTKADAAAANRKLTTRYAFGGRYRDATFKGNAYTGDVLSFQKSEIPFPISGQVLAGTTKLEVDGVVADVVKISSIDTKLRITGQTMANLYPFLLLPLPASPPYDVSGRLKLEGNKYTMDDLKGKIGSTDVTGHGRYFRQEPRPLLQAELHSKLLKLEDLGPLVGLKTKDTKGGAQERPTQAATATRTSAAGTEQQAGGNRVLPTGTFEATRIRAIDADVSLDARQIVGPDELALEDFYASLHVKQGLLTLTPLRFGFAGGNLVSKITVDARQDKLKGAADVDFRNIQIAKLFPTMPKVAQGAGAIGAQIRLRGEGNNVADLLGSSNGTAGVAIADGRISNLIDAAVSLNGGKLLPLWLTGDKDIAIRCGGAAFDVKNGVATSTLFVVDTEQTRIDGSATVDLRNERFAMQFEPKPKRPGILSLRTPINLSGSFRHADFALDKKMLALRAGGAAALALVSPVAILLPLLEPGPGKDTDCGKVLEPVQGAQMEAQSNKASLPKPLTANRPKAADQAQATGDAKATASARDGAQKKLEQELRKDAAAKDAGKGAPAKTGATRQARGKGSANVSQAGTQDLGPASTGMPAPREPQSRDFTPKDGKGAPADKPAPPPSSAGRTRLAQASDSTAVP